MAVQFGWRPTVLLVRLRRYRCTGCGHVWRQDMTKAAAPRAKISLGGLRWALTGLVCQHLSVARIAEALAVSWHTANAAVLAEGRRVLINDPARFDGVQVLGVDEHVWRHTRRGDKGEFKWSSQHLDMEVLDGQEAAGCGSCAASEDAFTGQVGFSAVG